MRRGRILRLRLFFFASRRRHTSCLSDWSSVVCSSDLAPMPETAAALLAELRPRREPLRAGMSRALEQVRGVRVDERSWDLSRVEPHLRMRFAIEEDGGRVVAEGEDLDALRLQVRPLLRAELSGAAAG